MEVDFRCALISTLVALGYVTPRIGELLSDVDLLNLYKQAFVAQFDPSLWQCE